jgi:hypothetical protein
MSLHAKNSSKATLPENQQFALGAAVSSCLMGDTAMFTPQTISLPKVKIHQRR